MEKNAKIVGVVKAGEGGGALFDAAEKIFAKRGEALKKCIDAIQISEVSLLIVVLGFHISILPHRKGDVNLRRVKFFWGGRKSNR